jgi:NADPH2:quinone reductase
MGADEVLDHSKNLQEQLQHRGLKNVDYIFNTANTSQYWSQMAEVIRPFGRICSIVESAEPVDLTLMMKKSVSFSWELMFTRSLYETEDLSRQSEILEQVARWVGSLTALKNSFHSSCNTWGIQSVLFVHRLGGAAFAVDILDSDSGQAC